MDAFLEAVDRKFFAAAAVNGARPSIYYVACDLCYLLPFKSLLLEPNIGRILELNKFNVQLNIFIYMVTKPDGILALELIPIVIRRE